MSTTVQNVRPSTNDLWVSLVLYLELMSIELVTNTVQRVRVLHTQFPNLSNASPMSYTVTTFTKLCCAHINVILPSPTSVNGRPRLTDSIKEMDRARARIRKRERAHCQSHFKGLNSICWYGSSRL